MRCTLVLAVLLLIVSCSAKGEMSRYENRDLQWRGVVSGKEVLLERKPIPGVREGFKTTDKAFILRVYGRALERSVELARGNSCFAANFLVVGAETVSGLVKCSEGHDGESVSHLALVNVLDGTVNYVDVDSTPVAGGVAFDEHMALAWGGDGWWLARGLGQDWDLLTSALPSKGPGSVVALGDGVLVALGSGESPGTSLMWISRSGEVARTRLAGSLRAIGSNGTTVWVVANVGLGQEGLFSVQAVERELSVRRVPIPWSTQQDDLRSLTSDVLVSSSGRPIIYREWKRKFRSASAELWQGAERGDAWSSESVSPDARLFFMQDDELSFVTDTGELRMMKVTD